MFSIFIMPELPLEEHFEIHDELIVFSSHHSSLPCYISIGNEPPLYLYTCFAWEKDVFGLVRHRSLTRLNMSLPVSCDHLIPVSGVCSCLSMAQFNTCAWQGGAGKLAELFMPLLRRFLYILCRREERKKLSMDLLELSSFSSNFIQKSLINVYKI